MKNFRALAKQAMHSVDQALNEVVSEENKAKARAKLEQAKTRFEAVVDAATAPVDTPAATDPVNIPVTDGDSPLADAAPAAKKPAAKAKPAAKKPAAKAKPAAKKTAAKKPAPKKK